MGEGEQWLCSEHRGHSLVVAALAVVAVFTATATVVGFSQDLPGFLKDVGVDLGSDPTTVRVEPLELEVLPDSGWSKAARAEVDSFALVARGEGAGLTGRPQLSTMLSLKSIPFTSVSQAMLAVEYYEVVDADESLGEIARWSGDAQWLSNLVAEDRENVSGLSIDDLVLFLGPAPTPDLDSEWIFRSSFEGADFVLHPSARQQSYFRSCLLYGRYLRAEGLAVDSSGVSSLDDLESLAQDAAISIDVLEGSRDEEFLAWLSAGAELSDKEISDLQLGEGDRLGALDQRCKDRSWLESSTTSTTSGD